MVLLDSQKNTLFRLIEQSGTFTPNQFEFKETQGITQVRFSNSKYFCSFQKTTNNSIYLTYSPGEEDLVSNAYFDYWSEALLRFESWLYFISREISEPNLWDRLSENVQLVNLSTNQNNNQFTVSEYEDLKQKMISLGSQLRALPFLAESIGEVEDKIDHLTIMAQTLSKRDWFGLFLGTFMGLLTNLATTPENIAVVFNIIRQIFKGTLIN